MMELQKFLVRQEAVASHSAEHYGIFNAQDGQQVGQAKKTIGAVAKVVRLLFGKKRMPITVESREYPEDSLVFVIKKPFSFFRSSIVVYDSLNEKLGRCIRNRRSRGGGFWVLDKNDRPFAEIKGEWNRNEFQYVAPDGTVFGEVTKNRANSPEPIFGSAGSYVVSIGPLVARHPIAKMLLLAAALAIDIIYYEEDRGP